MSKYSQCSSWILSSSNCSSWVSGINFPYFVLYDVIGVFLGVKPPSIRSFGFDDSRNNSLTFSTSSVDIVGLLRRTLNIFLSKSIFSIHFSRIQGFLFRLKDQSYFAFISILIHKNGGQCPKIYLLSTSQFWIKNPLLQLLHELAFVFLQKLKVCKK